MKKKSSQLDKYRIDKLNEIGFQWSLASYTVVSWDDRFEVSLGHLHSLRVGCFSFSSKPFIHYLMDFNHFQALKRFKEKNGHTKIPRNHPDFGNWPVYQKAQYKLFKAGKKAKITEDKVAKLLAIGFLETKKPSSKVTEALNQAKKGGGYDSGAFDWSHPTDA